MINWVIIGKPYNWFVVGFSAIILVLLFHVFLSPND